MSTTSLWAIYCMPQFEAETQEAPAALDIKAGICIPQLYEPDAEKSVARSTEAVGVISVAIFRGQGDAADP